MAPISLDLGKALIRVKRKVLQGSGFGVMGLN